MRAPAVYRGDGSGREEVRGNYSAQSQDVSQSTKPDIDLQSWAELGGKPSRDRRQKKSWKRGASK